MKTKFTVSILLGLLTFAFILNSSSTKIYVLPVPENNNISDRFLIGAMAGGTEQDYSLLTDSLHYNLWHRYINGGQYSNGTFWIHGWRDKSIYDTLDAHVSSYQSGVTGALTDNWMHSNMYTLMERPKTRRLAFGQRSDYQCEVVNSGDLKFYAYNTHQTGSDVPDSGAMVRRCLTIPALNADNPGFVVKRLRANNEQCNTSTGRWEGDNYYSWVIKPRIRIDSSFAFYNRTAKVFKVIVLNFKGDTIKTTDIMAGQFRNQLTNSYRGQYIEEYFFNSGDSNLVIPNSFQFNPDTTFWAFTSRGENQTDQQCKADIQVYWYGNCDMWIDYVRVDNDVADRLFKGYYDDPIHHPESPWLKWEAQDIGLHNQSPLVFYIEEFEFNNIPCMKYVNQKLDSLSNGRFSLMFDLNYTTYNAHMPSPAALDFGHVKRNLYEALNSKHIMTGSYAFTGTDTGGFNSGYDARIPNTLPNHDFSVYNGILANPYPPSNYDTWLQNMMDTIYDPYKSNGNFTFLYKNLHNISKELNIPFINLQQAHLWYSKGHKLREPTNEELELSANLAITYGARGNLYFWYGFFGNMEHPLNDYGRGLIEPTVTPPAFTSVTNEDNYHNIVPVFTTSYKPRYLNVYGQKNGKKLSQ